MTQTLRHRRLQKNLRKSKSMKEAMMKSDYSENYANASTQLKKTKGYQKTMKPVIEQYEKELQKILTAMEKKDVSNEQYQVLVKSADTIQKQVQLLGGKPTEIIDDYKDIPTDELQARRDAIRGRAIEQRTSKKTA